MKTVKVQKLAETFPWEQITGDQESLEREVEMVEINRPGLELAGHFPATPINRLSVLGEKECRFIEEEMDEVDQRRSFEFLTSDDIPAILICHGCQCPEVLADIARRKNFPVFKSNTPTSMAIVSVTNYLEEELAESLIIHGEFMRIYGIGVLITGRSGVGKSEIALELIKRGHQIIADDRVDCYKMHNTIVGRAPELIKGFMEMRGIGVVNVARMFGIRSMAQQATLELHIELEPFDDSVQYDRVGIEKKEYTDILDQQVLRMRIPVSPGRPLGTIIETAVTNYLLIKNGMDSAKEFEDKVLKKIEQNQDEPEEVNELISNT